MNKYVKLITNTLLFAIGTFSSKVLSFLMMPFLTRVLKATNYGMADQVFQIGNLLIPLITVGILNSVIRFGLDRSVRKSDVFTTGLVVILGGFAVFVCFAPLLLRMPKYGEYMLLIYLFVLMSTMRSLCSQFVRAKEYVKLYAIDGVLATGTMILFNILFLAVFDLGVVGNVLATVASDFCSVIFLTVIARLWRYIRFRRGIRRTAMEMLRYGVPMFPTNMSWWFINASGRFVISFRLGDAVNGLYAAAFRIPTLITTLSNIFIDAWQISAVTEKEGEERSHFFSNVFGAFQSVVFLSASGMIAFSKIIMTIMSAEEFYTAWKFIPVLAVAMAFSCLGTFLGSVYIVKKRSVLALSTVLAGAAVNVVLCGLLVNEQIGANGAAVAMLLSYVTMFLLRAVSAYRMMHMRWNVPKLLLNVTMVLVQSYVMIHELPYWTVWQIGLVLASFVINFRPILLQMRRMLADRRRV